MLEGMVTTFAGAQGDSFRERFVGEWVGEGLMVDWGRFEGVGVAAEGLRFGLRCEEGNGEGRRGGEGRRWVVLKKVLWCFEESCR